MKQLNIKLERPLVFFDLETTGLKPTDRIVSISVLKIFPDGQREGKSAIVNPEMPIPKNVSDVHGITDEMVKDKPMFKQIGKSLYAFIDNCDIAGFNNNMFDNVILCEEFGRLGLEFPKEGVLSVDACAIFKKMEQRTLSAAYKFYCDKNLDDAHTSDADTIATYEVFVEQVEKYEELKGKTLVEIAEFCKMDNRVDLAGKVIKNEAGEYLFNFGKHKDQKVLDNSSYAEWMLVNDFSENTKAVLRKILKSKDEVF